MENSLFTLSWSPAITNWPHVNFSANPLPHPIANATVVPFGDSFLLVGRISTGSLLLSTIYHYKPQEDSWTLLDAKMKEANSGVIAMLVEREMLDK
jgi:hypothetical protein